MKKIVTQITWINTKTQDLTPKRDDGLSCLSVILSIVFPFILSFWESCRTRLRAMRDQGV